MEKSYIRQVLIAFDQFLNAAICNGWADETMSSNAWRMEQEGRFWGKLMRPIIDTLFFFDDNHCQESFENERNRTQSPPETR